MQETEQYNMYILLRPGSGHPTNPQILIQENQETRHQQNIHSRYQIYCGIGLFVILLHALMHGLVLIITYFTNTMSFFSPLLLLDKRCLLFSVIVWITCVVVEKANKWLVIGFCANLNMFFGFFVKHAFDCYASSDSRQQ